MRRLLGVLAICCAPVAVAYAQGTPDLMISISGHQLLANGPERQAVAFHARPVTPGKTTSGTIALLSCGELLSAAQRNWSDASIYGGWSVDVTPIRFVDDAVTFRLRWSRVTNRALPATPNEDIEITLKPGESRLLDSVRVSPTPAEKCETRLPVQTASLRVSVDRPEADRRLVGIDMWLVEYSADGREQTHGVQYVRGQPYKEIPFYFDSLTDGKYRFDVFGHITADLEHGGLDIGIEAIRAGADPGQSGYQSAHFFRSKQRLQQNEIVEIALQGGDDGRWPANRKLSLRIRAVMLR